MRKVLGIILVVMGVVWGVFYFLNGKEAIAPAVVPPAVNTELEERANVETYLRDNISELSPVPAVLGGTWYVVSLTVDVEKNSGTVVYEDGHIQETRNFSYTANERGEILNLIIQ